MIRLAHILKPSLSNNYKYTVCMVETDIDEVAQRSQVYGTRDNYEDAKKLAHSIPHISKVIYSNGKSRSITI